jgi:hypothetical protein
MAASHAAYAAKPNPAISSKSCSKSCPGAPHMVLYASKKGSQTPKKPNGFSTLDRAI